ncbi:MAG: hypothetical protein NTV40_03695 [Solirubrobacterales bacterium]|nr:hypothetical protein [Solirubrobacterales bacterium]
MAPTKRKRRSKHRGNAAGLVETRGRTGRKPEPSEKKKSTTADRREVRQAKPPTWRSAATRALFATVIFFAIILLAFGQKLGPAIALAGLMLVIYIPLGYFTDLALHRRFKRKQAVAANKPSKPSGPPAD